MATWNKSNNLHNFKGYYTSTGLYKHSPQQRFDIFEARVEADGGEIIDAALTLDFFEQMIEAGYYGYLGFACFPSCGIKKIGTNLVKVYDLGPLENDFQSFGSVTYDDSTYDFSVATFASGEYAYSPAFKISLDGNVIVAQSDNTTGANTMVSIQGDGGSGSSPLSITNVNSGTTARITVRTVSNTSETGPNNSNPEFMPYINFLDKKLGTVRSTGGDTDYDGSLYATIPLNSAPYDLTTLTTHFYVNAINVHSATPTVGTTGAGEYAGWMLVRRGTVAWALSIASLFEEFY